MKDASVANDELEKLETMFRTYNQYWGPFTQSKS